MLQSSKLIQVTDKLYFVGLSLYLWSSNYTSPYIIIRLIILQSKFLHNLSIACFGFFLLFAFSIFHSKFSIFFCKFNLIPSWCLLSPDLAQESQADPFFWRENRYSRAA